jgi:hypothetical protein
MEILFLFTLTVARSSLHDCALTTYPHWSVLGSPLGNQCVNPVHTIRRLWCHCGAWLTAFEVPICIEVNNDSFGIDKRLRGESGWQDETRDHMCFAAWYEGYAANVLHPGSRTGCPYYVRSGRVTTPNKGNFILYDRYGSVAEPRQTASSSTLHSTAMFR